MLTTLRPPSPPSIQSGLVLAPSRCAAPSLQHAQEEQHVQLRPPRLRQAEQPLQPPHRLFRHGTVAAIGAAGAESEVRKPQLQLHDFPVARARPKGTPNGELRLDADDFHGSADFYPRVQLLHVAVEHANAARAGPPPD